ncbi:uncharacterized protein B0P05DRAFT_554815 [Gilbertella persicaria]|uniref:uncharacterized protein n=1 Tax=Gilbertella persicaria TaxID=101096 RepID=UPI00221EE8B6|nr:uncharacterized protein B0P05DRAFT_554815 [Gilbertella persicaria]KAI8064276.1 hypothetical protein B0P05DRAFT_554815 [Gilbertella persicaria]
MNTKNALFSATKIGNLQLKHRVVLCPLTRYRATKEAVPTDLQVEYYKQRASEGGLLITEATFISPSAGSYPQAPGIFSKEQIEGWKKVTHAVHEKKAYIYLQLWHIGRAGSHLLNPNHEPTVSASAIPIQGKDMLGNEFDTPRSLEVNEIKSIVQEYRQASLNAIEAGFDGVEIHSANGYLLDQFLNSNSNQRADEYGGSVENRARFTLEVTDAVVDAVGPERTGIRFSPGGSFQDMKDKNPVETWGYVTSELQKRHPDLAYVHFIEPRSTWLSDDDQGRSDSLEPFRRLWQGPFINSSGFSNNKDHAYDIAEKTGDLIAFGRAFIANPDLPERLRNGWELNKYDRSTFYTHDAKGYVDYPFYNTDKK